MTAPSRQEVERIARRLSDAQREYIVEGPYPHWTQTRWSLERRGILQLGPSRYPDRSDFTPLGIAVRDYLREVQP